MSRDIVVIHSARSGAPMYTHEKITLSAVAQAIARITECEFSGC